MYCMERGTEISAEEKFCKKCGSQVEVNVQVADSPFSKTGKNISNKFVSTRKSAFVVGVGCVAILVSLLFIYKYNYMDPVDEYKTYTNIDFPRILTKSKEYEDINYPAQAQAGKISVEMAKVKMSEQFDLCNVATNNIENLRYRTDPAKSIAEKFLQTHKLQCLRYGLLLEMVKANDPVVTNRVMAQVKELDNNAKEAKAQLYAYMKKSCEKYECEKFSKQLVAINQARPLVESAPPVGAAVSKKEVQPVAKIQSYTMALICTPYQGKLAELAIKMLMDLDSVQFGYAMNTAGFAQNCTMAGNTVSNQPWMSSMREVGRKGNNIYWYAEMPNGNSFTGIGLISNQ